MPKLLLFILNILLLNIGVCVVSPAKLHKACLNRSTSVLTVVLSSPTDVCGSFTQHRLYGREDALSQWKLLAYSNTLYINSISALLTSKKTWEVFLVTSNTCNGKDSLESNHLFIDDKAPSQFEPDSVSIDFGSQQMVAGWTKPADPDILGYSLFKFQGGGNLLIKDTISNNYKFPLAIFDPKNTDNLFAIAAYDSCLNGGLISNYHSPIELTLQKDVKFYCKKSTIITWVIYKGWLVGKYQIWRCEKATMIWTLLGVVNSDLVNNPKSYSFKDSTYSINTNYYYLVRGYKQGTSISSSSNAVTEGYFHTVGVGPVSQISGVSVLTPTKIQIDIKWQSDDNNSVIKLQRFNNTSWQTINSSSATGNFSSNDNGVNSSLSSYYYRAIRQNNCGYIDDSSCISKTILLTEYQRIMKWNGYVGWGCKGVNSNFQYAIEIKQGSTWNVIHSSYDSTFQIPADIYNIQTFRIMIRSSNGVFPYDYELYSNEIVVALGRDTSKTDTLLIPSAFSPGGVNKYFKISNPAISPGESFINIYNRWGEKIFTGDALIGWDGHLSDGDTAIAGTYVYTLEANYLNKHISKSGTLILLDQ